MKRKITLAIAVMLALVMALSSCGISGTKIEKILNADYDIAADVYGEATNIAELDGYTVDDTVNNGFFLLLTKADAETGNETTKIFSLYTGKVVYTCTTTDTVVYDVLTYSEVPAFFVTETPVPAEGSDAKVEPTYYLYDATGAQISNTKYAPAAPYMVGEDLAVYNYVGYTVDKEGKFEKKMDIPEYLGIREIDAANDKYYYVMDEESVIVYDLEFNVVSTWMAPSYVYEDGYNMTAVLENGDIFVQYVYLLDEDAEDFDLYDENGKYELVHLVINAKTGKTKEVKLDYLVMMVIANNELYDEDEENNAYTDKFDNLAAIFPIIDKNVDTTEKALEYALMSNNGKIKSILDYADDMTNLGLKIADDLYAVNTVAGVVIIKGNGKVVKTLNNDSLEFVDGYMIGEIGIYNMDFELIYDFRENKVKEEPVIVGDTIFVKAEKDKGYDIISFNGGEQKTVYSFNPDAEKNNTFNYFEGIGYYIIDANNGEYTYYNADGAVIIKISNELDLVTYGEDFVVLSATIDDVVKYYVANVIKDAE